MSMSKDERDKLKKENDARAAKNEAIRENIAKLNAMPNSTNVLKYKLYEEQDHKCAYSMETLDINHLFEDGYYEIDHIIPYSRSFDDSFNNKVLVLKPEKTKTNAIPRLSSILKESAEITTKFLHSGRRFIRNATERNLNFCKRKRSTNRNGKTAR